MQEKTKCPLPVDGKGLWLVGESGFEPLKS